MTNLDLKDLSDEELADLIARREHIVTKQSNAGAFDVGRAIADQEYQLQRKSYQPQQTASDDQLVSVSYLDAYAENLADTIGEESGKMHREIRDEIKAAVEPLIRRIEELEQGETSLPKFLDSKRDTVMPIKSKANGKVA